MKLIDSDTRDERGTLPTRFKEKHYIFDQKIRTGNVAIYERSRENNPESSTFEVVRIRYQNGGERKYKDKVVVIKPGEYYPSESEWGKHAFSCNSMGRAEVRMAEMLEQEKVKEANPEAQHKRGRKALNITLAWPKPKVHFLVKDIVEASGGKASPAYVHLKLYELIDAGKAEFVTKKKVTPGRGKPASVYQML